VKDLIVPFAPADKGVATVAIATTASAAALWIAMARRCEDAGIVSPLFADLMRQNVPST
jgi:hypothetical protein